MTGDRASAEAASSAEMWRHYTFRGHEVVVVQQWADPFGRRMVRIASAAPGEEEAAAGMTEDEFLAEAQPAAASPTAGLRRMSDRWLEVRIAERHEQADGIIVLDLVPVDGGVLPPFEAGAHVDVLVGPDLVRQYSLCGDPARTDRYRLGILLDPATRGGSAAAHEPLHEGERILIGLPRNDFPLAADAGASVLVGGGIGITPLLAMAHHLDAAQRDFTLHYCTRARAKAAFLDELAEARYRGSVRLHFDDGPAEQRFDPARDLPPPGAGAHLYICGPTGFMDWVIGAARAQGYPEARIHKEYFGAEVDGSGGAFEVVLAKSGRTVPVAAGQSIVEALKGVGVRVEVSCEQGVCGTCLCDVLEGVPDHRDSYLTDEEHAGNDQMTLCCSRALTPQLVLDL